MSIAKVIWIRRRGGWDAVLDGKVVGHIEDRHDPMGSWTWSTSWAHGACTEKGAAFRAVAQVYAARIGSTPEAEIAAAAKRAAKRQ